MKSLRRSTSILLSVLLLLGIALIAFEPIKVNAVEFSNVPEYPDFDMDCYVADLFTTEGHSLNKSIEMEMNSKTTNDVMKNGIESNSLLMGSMAAWQAATFEASDVTHDSVTQVGYYESIILSSLNTAMKSSRVKDAFDNAVIKDGKLLFSSFKEILKAEYFITDFSLDKYKSLPSGQQSAYIKSFEEAFKKQYPNLDKTSDALKTFSTVVTAAKSFEECMNNYAAYYHCSMVNKYLAKVVNDLYEQCPSEQVTLKAALLNISSACTSVELDFGADVLDTIYRGADVLFGIISDGWVTKIISAHPAGLALMIGRAVGKSVSNILFSTDAICENYYKMCCFDEFEKLVRSVTKYEMNTYINDKSNYNANCVFWAVRLMFNINEESCDLSINYAKTIYEGSVAGIFLNKTEYENFKNSVESIRRDKQQSYSNLKTSYIFFLEEDYPEIYSAYMKLENEIENPTVHVMGVSFPKKHMEIGLADDTFFFWNNAEVSPSNASNKVVTYTSSDESVISIKPANTLDIEVHKVGTAIITVTTEDGRFTDTLTIDVVEGHGTDGVHLEDPVTNIKASGKCGDNAYWSLYNSGLLKIYGTGKMYDTDSYDGAPWFDERYLIKNIVIGSCVTSIGDRAFDGCRSLTSVTIPDSVTSIGDRAFESCERLTRINIPDSVTSIGEAAFLWCERLTRINIPDSVTIIGEGAFEYCENLTSINIPNSVASIGDCVFLWCKKLTNINIPDSVTSIGDGAFAHCRSLTSVTIPDSVTSVGDSAFYDTGYYNNENNWENDVLYIGNHLIKAKESISGDYIIRSGTKTIADNVFYECTSLISVTISDSVTNIGDSAFYNCTSLNNVTIPNSVTSIERDTFRSCTSLASVTIGNSVTYLSDYAFYNCKSLKNVTIPDSVTSIGAGAFEYCENLTSVTIGNGVTSIGKAGFIGCTSLTSVTIGNSVTSIGDSAFDYCTSLTSITVPDSVTQIGYGAFSVCENLTSINIPNSVTSIERDMFLSCKSLKSITIPDSVMRIGEGAFRWCESLSDVYYTGNQEEWNRIKIYMSNESLKKASIHFNSHNPEITEQMDANTGIIITSTDGTELTVNDVTGTDEVSNNQINGETISKVYDIALTKDGTVVQPDGAVTVKIPCTDENAKVYLVEEGNSLTDMNAVYKDDYMEFTTERLNKFIVAVPKEAFMIGDTNLNGVISISDVTEIQRHLAELQFFTDEQIKLADTNGDGKIDITDATHLQMYLAEFDGIVLGKQ